MLSENLSDKFNPDLDARVCSNCRFFVTLVEEVSGRKVGNCRRRAPSPYLAGQVLEKSYFDDEFTVSVGWPIVLEDDWCGEHIANVEKLQDDVDAGV
jgi:hypothetical protein